MVRPSGSKRLPLRIAQIAPLIESIPPKKYGGTERVVYFLTEELIRRGHSVTLFASGDSQTSAKLQSVYPLSLREARIPDLYGANPFTLMHIGNAYEKQGNFDIIHDHLGFLSLPTANLSRRPVVMTYHGPFTGQVRRMFAAMRHPHIVSISKSQAELARDLNQVGVVYNGLSMESYPFSEEHDGYLLAVGRFSMEKGIHHAIEVAQYLSIPLIIAAKLDPIDMPYFNQYIAPKLSDRQVRWIGEVDEATRNRLMSRALCFLHPVTWREPFGLVMIEAMACGAPVVAFRRGSIPEIVHHGKTGFVVDNVDEMIDAVMGVRAISRRECRRHALRNFNVGRMVDSYEAIYYRVLGR